MTIDRNAPNHKTWPTKHHSLNFIFLAMADMADDPPLSSSLSCWNMKFNLGLRLYSSKSSWTIDLTLWQVGKAWRVDLFKILTSENCSIAFFFMKISTKRNHALFLTALLKQKKRSKLQTSGCIDVTRSLLGQT